jgi:hypothetical protein
MVNIEPTNLIITPPPATTRSGVHNPIVWLTYQFAPDWFKDASEQAKIRLNHNARRREIVFSVCCTEAYLVEWVWNEVLKDDHSKFNTYFPPESKRSPEEKWKEVPKQLEEHGLICKSPDWGRAEGQTIWCEWKKLLSYRHGLVHARASRPETHPQSDTERPVPSKHLLDELDAGWATRTVVKLITYLHKAAGTQTPKWLIQPDSPS